MRKNKLPMKMISKCFKLVLKNHLPSLRISMRVRRTSLRVDFVKRGTRHKLISASIKRSLIKR